MILTAAAVVIGIAVWDTCWRVGQLRDDQELKESGVVFGAAAGGLAMLGSVFVWPPTYGTGTSPPVGVAVEWVAPHAVNVMLLLLVGLLAVEYGFISRVREHDRLLVKPIEERGGA